jgi:hypothetical protein
MMGGFIHDLEDRFDKVKRDFFVKQIAHGIDENNARFSPGERLRETFPVKTHREAVPVFLLSHQPQPASHPVSVTVLTAQADFRTAGDGIPGIFSPFYGGFG